MHSSCAIYCIDSPLDLERLTCLLMAEYKLIYGYWLEMTGYIFCENESISYFLMVSRCLDSASIWI